MKNRNAALDIVKFFLSLFVVIYHQYNAEGKLFNENFDKFDSWLFNIFVLFLVCPVPLFILISGYLSSFSKKDKLNSFFKLGIDILLYWVFAIAVTIILISSADIKISLNRTLTFGGRDWWYIWAFLIIKSISPILINGIKKTDKFISLTGIIFLVFMRIFFIQTNFGELFNGGSILAFLAIYLIGIWIGVHGKEILNSKRNYQCSIAICLLLMLIGIIFKSFSYILGFNLSKILSFGTPTHLIPLIFSICLFNIILKFNLKETKMTKLIASITFPIYLFHFFFEITLNQLIWSKVGIDKSNIGMYELNFFFGIITWLTTIFFFIINYYSTVFYFKMIKYCSMINNKFDNKKMKLHLRKKIQRKKRTISSLF
ncbi:acyltransferase family protein [Mesoplasma coleopterae]|uniref:acyltransferase family protein n=1 Tax=Mesoplasma coleopterae TaxID=324078 RepID=UPI000F4E6E08|nr:acyltransferase [Mesoplasma coleopterae]